MKNFFLLVITLIPGVIIAQPAKIAEIENREQSVISMVTAPDGHLLTGGDDNTVRVWDVSLKKQVYSFSGNNDWITALAISSGDGDQRQYLAAGCRDGSINIYDYESKSLYYQVKSNSQTINDLIFLERFGILLGASRDGNLTFIDLESKNAQMLQVSPKDLQSLSFLEAEDLVIAGDGEGNMKFISPVSRSIEKVVQDRQDF